MKNEIIMIMPYFGKLPKWIKLYLYSCKKNEFIDYLFITDCEEMESLKSDNVRVVITSFENYCLFVSNKLGINFFPSSPYKICDLRPFFDVIHEDYLKDYTFWGYGDIDVVYGDLKILLSSKRLRKYDIISAHTDRLSGHFLVIRKYSCYSKIGYKIKDWRQRLENDYVFGLDEHDFTALVFPAQKIIWSLHRRLGRWVKAYSLFDFFNSFFNLFSRHYLKEYFTSLIPKDNEIWEYNIKDGRVYSPQKRELPYLHFLFFKKTKFHDAKNYWREDFWQLPDKDINELTSTTICFTNRFVYEKD